AWIRKGSHLWERDRRRLGGSYARGSSARIWRMDQQTWTVGGHSPFYRRCSKRADLREAYLLHVSPTPLGQVHSWRIGWSTSKAVHYGFQNTEKDSSLC